LRAPTSAGAAAVRGRFDGPGRDFTRSARGVVIGLALLGTAIGVGALATVDAYAAIAVVLGVALVLLIFENVRALPLFLIVTMFVESLALGPGLRIGRIAAVMAVAVVAYYVLERGKIDLRPNALLVAVGAFGAWMLLSLYWASDAGLVYDTSGRYLLALAYMVTFAVLVRSRGQLGAIFMTLACGALVFGTLSFAGYAASVNAYRVSTDPRTLGGIAGSGLQGDHNYFAVYQVVALPPALAIAGLARRATTSAFYYAVVGVIVLSVVASLSRTGLIVLGSVVVVTLLLPARFFFKRVSHKVTYFVVLGLAGFLVALAGAEPFVKRALTIFREHGVSGARGSGRIDLWRAAWHGFQEHPFVGLGAGNFRGQSADLLQTTPGVNNIGGNVALTNKYVHNMYLELLTELGIVGLVLFLLVLALTARYLLLTIRRSRASGDPTLEKMALALLVTLCGFAISGFFLSVELNKPLWIVIGLALALDVMSRRASGRKARATAPPRAAPTIGPGRTLSALPPRV
jgi:O-antigen ligase